MSRPVELETPGRPQRHRDQGQSFRTNLSQRAQLTRTLFKINLDPSERTVL